MLSQETRPPHPAITTWSEAAGLLRGNPILFFPLGVSAGIKFLLLFIALVAPFKPFSRVMAPVVRYFWGEVYLHYPYHMALAARLFRRADILLPILLEGFLVGVVAFLCRQFLSGQPAKANPAFSASFRRYPATALVAMISAVTLLISFQLVIIPLRYGFRWLPSLSSPNSFVGIFFMGLVSVLLASVLETFFIFAVPLCVLQQRPLFRAIGTSWRIGFQNFWPIFLGLSALSLLYLPFILLRQGSGQVALSPWPEVLLFIYSFRILAAWGITTLFSVWASVYLIRHVERSAS